jgi:outer membrane protein OmpA-like peptidoglycan-associated protein/tetratricopeptide (TPR) repeat protein
MKVQLIYILLAITVVNCHVYSQKVALQKGDKKYDNYAYIDAIKIYERIAEKGYKNEEMFRKLGNAYYFNSEYDSAAQWYDELFILNSDQDPEYYYRYAQTVKALGNYTKAQNLMTEFARRASNDRRAQLFSANTDYLTEIRQNSGRYHITDAGINTEYSEYGGAFFDNKFVFTTDRDTGTIGQRKFQWTGKFFSNLVSAEVKSDGGFGEPVKFNSAINSKYNEASAVFTQDGKTMYFTRNNFIKGSKGKSKDNIVLLKIYQATFDGLKWSDVKELPFNSNDYSVAHPALSPDDKMLYFASDMPGTKGQSDIWRVKILPEGKFGTPENLGEAINTEGKETFPFISDDNEIYFASDGHPGLGGLDIFAAKITKDSFGKVHNVGEPVNSSFDDFAYIIDSASRNGFFSSNRDTGKGLDDIYRFIEIKKIECEQKQEGIIRDQDTNLPLADVKVTLYDHNMVEVRSVYTDTDGLYSFGTVACGSVYHIRAQKREYETVEEVEVTPEVTGITHVPIVLGKRVVKIEPGTDLAHPRILNIITIYFDLDKSDIRQQAAYELEKILAVMQEYPNMKVDVRSHTDSRQTHAYNQKLSDRRAKSTIAWLVSKGIDPKRLTGRGYGETQLVNGCADNVECTEEQHQMNRRSQFIITSME